MLGVTIMYQQQQAYYANDTSLYDNEFNNQYQRYIQSQTVPIEVLNRVVADWNAGKLQCINTLQQRCGGNISHQAIQQMIAKFLEVGISGYCRGGVQQQQPMYYNNQNTYQQQVQPQQLGYGYTQPMYNPVIGGGVPMQGVNNYQQGMSNVTRPATPTSTTASYVDINAFTKEAMSTNEPPKTNTATTPDQLTTTTNSYICPRISTDIIDRWANKSSALELADGSVKITHMESAIIGPYDHVLIELNGNYNSIASVIATVKKLVNTVSTAFHIEVAYNKLVPIKIPYERMKSMMDSFKKEAAIAAAAPSNRLKYISTIFNIINQENRGVADTIDSFLVEEFVKYARAGCINSNVEPAEGFTIGKLDDLIRLSNPNTADEKAKACRNMPGFEERLTVLCNQTIKPICLDGEVLNPNNADDMMEILDSHDILAHVLDDGTIIDVSNIMCSKVDDYTKASADDKINLYGDAGKILSEYSTLVIPNQKLIYTSFTPPVVNKLVETLHIKISNTRYGGDAFPDSDIEWLLVNYGGGDTPCDMVVVYDNDINIPYKVTKTTDNWISIYR